MGTKKYKIVCFVNNEVHDGIGLYNAFGNTLNYNPFVSKYLYVNSTKILGNNGNNYLLISEKNGAELKGEISLNDIWDIILIRDDLFNAVSDYPLCLFAPETLVMYHNTPFNSYAQLQEKQTSKEIRKCKEGHHIYGDVHGYTILSKLLENDIWNTDCEKIINSQKYNEAINFIIKWFDLNEKLNKALEFLHNSLGGKPADINILKKGDETFDLTNDIYKDKSLQGWIDVLKGKTSNKYDATLADVRDALLWHSGVIGENKVFV